MLDLNHAERRALSAAACLIGLGTVVRTLLAPGPASFEWRPVGERAIGTKGPAAGVAAALAREQRAQTPLAADERIDPNTAPPEELRRLPGVGPSLAGAILATRRTGAFRGPEDLERVPGIGEATSRRLAPFLRFDGRPPVPAGVDSGAGGAPMTDAGVGASSLAGARSAPGAGAPGCAGSLIDINRAGTPDLERLPGIGPKIAGRIVESRRLEGPFADVQALTRISGIGERTVARIGPLACAGKP